MQDTTDTQVGHHVPSVSLGRHANVMDNKRNRKRQSFN